MAFTEALKATQPQSMLRWSETRHVSALASAGLLPCCCPRPDPPKLMRAAAARPGARQPWAPARDRVGPPSRARRAERTCCQAEVHTMLCSERRLAKVHGRR